MTVLPDPAELAPSRDPAAYGRRPLLSRGFWIMMAFGALCLIAAVAVVALGPRLLATRPAETVPPAPPAPAEAPAYAPTPAPSPSVEAMAAAPGADVSALSERITRLESDDTRAMNAAADALAAAALSDAAAGPRPFANDLAAFLRLIPASPDALALAPLAQQGAPTRAALAAELTGLAARVSSAARAPGRDGSFMEQMAYAISRVIDIRRVDGGGTGPDAVLARAERLAGQGDLEHAVGLLDTLDTSARIILAPWREAAVRRMEIDHHIGAIRAQAIADLAAARRPAA